MKGAGDFVTKPLRIAALEPVRATALTRRSNFQAFRLLRSGYVALFVRMTRNGRAHDRSHEFLLGR